MTHSPPQAGRLVEPRDDGGGAGGLLDACGLEDLVAAWVPCEVGDLGEDARGLLDHAETMTRRLERRAGGELRLRLLRRHVSPDGRHYARVVALLAPDGTPLELGAIDVDLARLPSSVVAPLLAERDPLGRLLEEARSGVLRVVVEGVGRVGRAAVAASLARLGASELLRGAEGAVGTGEEAGDGADVGGEVRGDVVGNGAGSAGESAGDGVAGSARRSGIGEGAGERVVVAPGAVHAGGDFRESGPKSGAGGSVARDGAVRVAGSTWGSLGEGAGGGVAGELGAVGVGRGGRAETGSDPMATFGGRVTALFLDRGPGQQAEAPIARAREILLIAAT